MTLILILYLLVSIGLITACFIAKNWMRRIAIFITAIFVVLPICFLLFLGLFNTQIRKGEMLPQFASILNIVVPPKDLYVPLALGKIDVEKEGTQYRFNFVNKYIGNHAIGISFEKLPEGHYHDYKTNLEVSLKILREKQIILEKNNIIPTNAYWGGYNSVGGFTFFYYKVPEYLPCDTPLVCEIVIEKIDKDFISKFGEAEFFMRKSSDL